MAIIWTKLIPRWGGDTIEPPEDKKNTGYFAGDKPPAKWENWLRKGTYEALDETRDVVENIDLQLAQIAAQKANSQQPPWIPLPLQNSWRSYGAGFVTAKYRRSTIGNIEIEGFITDGTTSIIAILPSEYRPIETHRILTTTASNPVFIQISPDGTVSVDITPPDWVVSKWLILKASFWGEPLI